MQIKPSECGASHPATWLTHACCESGTWLTHRVQFAASSRSLGGRILPVRVNQGHGRFKLEAVDGKGIPQGHANILVCHGRAVRLR